VLTAEQMGGLEGDAVRALGEELDVRVRFKSVLPLGRGADLGLTPAFYSSLDNGAEAIAYGVRTAATCGLGMNLYIGPSGECYPCYALVSARHDLGNALKSGLAAVLKRNDAYRRVTVDSNRHCRHCALRYVCRGFCRAWSSSDDPDAPPAECTALYARARNLLLSAMESLDVSVERWMAAGLPLLASPPKVK
jgi:radical SAM protein with 4Fe4S-binding SPASM domain